MYHIATFKSSIFPYISEMLGKLLSFEAWLFHNFTTFQRFGNMIIFAVNLSDAINSLTSLSSIVKHVAKLWCCNVVRYA